VIDPKDEAQASLRDSGIGRGQIYRHYKGGLYSIVDVAIKEDTLEPLVIYRSNAKGTTWARTLANFTERAPGGGHPPIPRFQRVED
jgi:hypothetical protein